MGIEDTCFTETILNNLEDSEYNAISIIRELISCVTIAIEKKKYAEAEGTVAVAVRNRKT